MTADSSLTAGSTSPKRMESGLSAIMVGNATFKRNDSIIEPMSPMESPTRLAKKQADKKFKSEFEMMEDRYNRHMAKLHEFMEDAR